MQFTSQPSDQVAAPFLGYVATLTYDGADPARARQWVEANLSKVDAGKGAELTIGKVRFSLYGPATARILEFTPLP